MMRTQIQLPDELYERAKKIARNKEISLTELVRRGLECLLDQYPAGVNSDQEWNFPSLNLGVKVPLEDLRYYTTDDESMRSIAAEEE